MNIFFSSLASQVTLARTKGQEKIGKDKSQAVYIIIRLFQCFAGHNILQQLQLPGSSVLLTEEPFLGKTLSS